MMTKLYKTIAMVMVLTMLILLSGCGQTGSAASADPVAVLRDIATTQYFTEEAVAQADVETIVQAGINAPSAMNGQPWHFSVITDNAVLEQISGGMGGGMNFGGMAPGGSDESMTPPAMPEDMALPENTEKPEDTKMPAGMPDGMEKPEGMNFPDGMEPPEGMNFPGGMETPEGMTPPAAPQGGFGGTAKAGITDAPLVIVISCANGSELDAGLACQNMSATAQLLGYGTKIISSPTMVLNGSDQDTYRELLGIPQDYSAAAILLIGHEDTSVDTNADGYTGATARNSAEQVVTYITGK